LCVSKTGQKNRGLPEIVSNLFDRNNCPYLVNLQRGKGLITGVQILKHRSILAGFPNNERAVSDFDFLGYCI